MPLGVTVYILINMSSKIFKSEALGRVLASYNLPHRYFFTFLTAVFIATLILLYMAVGFNGDGEASPGLGTIETKRPTPDVLVKDTGPASLYSPHHINKLNDKWFIVDGWHHRVIWSYDLEAPIEEWGVVDNDLAGPHTIDYMHPYYVVDDTDRHAVNFYSYNEGEFALAHQLTGLGERTHRVRYHNETNTLYVLASNSQEMFEIKLNKNGPYVHSRTRLLFLKDAYTRSFTIVGDKMLFVSGPGQVIEATFRHGSYLALNSYKIPRDFRSMNDIFYDGKRYIITATGKSAKEARYVDSRAGYYRQGKYGAIGVVDSLSELPYARDQYHNLKLKGRPYSILRVANGELLIAEAGEYSRILRLSSTGTLLSVKQVLFDFGPPNEESVRTRRRINN